MGISHSLIETGQDAAAPADALEGAVSAKDFEAFQQQTTTSLQSATDALTAQQAELKRLADQIAGLTSKIDQMQTNAGPTPAPIVVRPTSAPSRPPVAAAPSHRRPVVPKPAGAISVGGAPLPVQPGR